MRKIFANLKSVVALAVVAAMTLSVSCMYDDTALTKRVNKVEKDLAALTERVNALENNESINDLLNGAAVITDVTVDEATGNTVITLSNGKTVTVLAKGLQYRVTDGVLEISADGQTWVAVTAAPDAVVESAVVNEDGTVTITLADGTEFTVAKAELIECEATRSGVYVPAGESKDVLITINDAVVDINIMNQPLGWSASVEEYVAPEEPGLDDGFGVLAVGGKDYVVRINAPAASFEAAATEGVVSVHFNTAAGACKVLSINVNLAKLTFDIDKDGNITIVNSLVEMKRSMIWGDYEGFANFFIGAVYKSDYVDFDGNLQSILNYGLPMSINQHDNLGAFFYEQYEVGVCEEEVATFTVEELFEEYRSSGMSDVTYTSGEEYVIFIAMPSKTGEADLKNVMAIDYKALKVAAEKVEGSETWNGADYKFTIVGYEYAVIGYVPQAEVDGLIEGGMCTDLDSFYDFHIANSENYGYPMIGALMELYEPWNEVLIPAAQLSQFNGAITPNTEYRLYALCFNMADFQAGKTFTHEDIYDFGTFTTTGLSAGEFDVISGSELVSWDSMGIKGYVYLTDDVTLSCYDIFEEPAVDKAQRVAEMLEDAYFTEGSEFDFYEYVGDSTKVYVGVLGVNSNGQYAYEEVEFSLESEEPEQPGDEVVISDMTFTSAVILEEANYGWGDFLLQFNADNGDYMVVNAFNIVTDNGAFYEGEWTFSSGNPGFFMGADFSYAVIGGVNYEIFAGNVVIAEVDGKYSFTFTNVNIMLNNEFVPFNASFLGTIEGMILPSEEANILPTVVYTKVENVEGNTWKFSNDAGEYLTIPFNSELVAGKYTASYSGEEFTYDVNNVSVSYNGKQTWLASGEVIDVVVNGDIYTISGQLAACDQDNGYSPAPFKFTYEGPLSAGSDEPVVYEGVEITSFEYVARSYELDDNPETSGGDFVYDITCADGNTFRLGLYWPFADAATGTILNGTYNYCYNALNAMYGGWEGFVIVSETFYYGAKLVVSDDQIALVMPDTTYVYNR